MVQRLCVFPELWTLAAMSLGFKLPLLELSLAQVGYSPLKGFITPLVLSRLIRLHSSPSTSLPYCAPNSFGESLLYILWYVSDYLLCRSLGESPEIQVSSTSRGSLWCEDRIDTWEGFSSWRAWGGDKMDVDAFFKVCLVLIFLNTIVENKYPEPWNYSFVSISCSKSPV